MSDRQDIELRLRKLIAKHLNVEASAIVPTSTLKDWAGDSLRFLETVFEIESRLGVIFPDDFERRVTDFASLADLVEQQLSQKTEPVYLW